MADIRLIVLFILLSVTSLSNSQSQDVNKFCRIQTSVRSRDIWNQWAGYSCYSYTSPYRLNFQYAVVPGTYNNKTIPVTLVNNNTSYFWYDCQNDTSDEYIKLSFKSIEFFDMWKQCCFDAIDCCDNSMNDTNIYPDDEYPCPAIWDSWSCFPQAKADTVQTVPCPSHIYSTTAEVCLLESEKVCFSNGTWNQETNYNVCSIAPYLRDRHNFHVIFLSVAIILSLPAVIIFLSFRKLRKKLRLILHRNLIIIIIIRNIFTIMTKEIIILDELKSSNSNNVMQDNGVACRVLAFFENTSKNGIYACMLADGFYLHKLIVRAFADDPNLKYLYAGIVVLSLIPSLIWAILRGAVEATDCWMIDTDGHQWVPDGFRIAILAINTVLLLDIIRVMVLKLRHSSASQQTKATFRATLFLIPLFGIHIIIIANRNIIPSNTCTDENAYFYLSYSLEALQGIMVSLLFCYISSEVQGELKNAYRKFGLYLQEKYGWNIRRETVSRRRTTAATYVEPTERITPESDRGFWPGRFKSSQKHESEI